MHLCTSRLHLERLQTYSNHILQWELKFLAHFRNSLCANSVCMHTCIFMYEPEIVIPFCKMQSNLAVASRFRIRFPYQSVIFVPALRSKNFVDTSDRPTLQSSCNSHRPGQSAISPRRAPQGFLRAYGNHGPPSCAGAAGCGVVKKVQGASRDEIFIFHF